MQKLMLLGKFLAAFLIATPVFAAQRTTPTLSTPTLNTPTLSTPTIATASATTTASSSATTTSTQSAQDLSALHDQYLHQLDAYRTDEQNYIVARDQFTQLQTLVSLEDAVQATRQVMSSRMDVLLTYMQMLRLTLAQTTGIDFQLKQQELKKIDTLLQDLTKHKTSVSTAVDRAHIDATVAQFVPIAAEFSTVVTEARALITYGKVRAVFDKTLVVRDEMKTAIEGQETDPLRLSQEKRSFDQIDQTAQTTDAQLKTLLSKLQAIIANPDQNGFQPSVISDQLNAAYAGVSRTLSYLQQVLGI